MTKHLLTRGIKIFFLLALVVLPLLLTSTRDTAIGAAGNKFTSTVPPVPTEPFSPSNARTEDGKLIPVEQFFSAARCASCHQDTHQGWSESLHRNAAREPFYRESADILLRTRGIEFTRHCESCHTPVALFSGALNKTSPQQEAPFTPLDHEGVTCSVCHSITEARLDGTGSFTIRRPALLAKEDGTPIFGDFTDKQILADIPAHKRAVMRPLLRQPEFCATCHKVDAPPSLNGYKHIKGFSAYDEWQQSGASTESVLPFYPRAQRADCRTCHMPKIPSASDLAAKQGVIASHRWLGANTAAPLFYGQQEQVELTESFLKAGVLNIDIFAIKREATGELIAPLSSDITSRLTPLPNEEVTAEIVISNRNAAHSFPPEVRDLYEAWVEFEAIDATGKMVFQSGFLKPDGMLDESAHVYKTIILDDAGRPITRHQIWLTAIKSYDNTIQAGRSDVARYRFRLPKLVGEKATTTVTLRARVNYRRVNQEYANYVLRRQKRDFSIPIVLMAEAEIKLGVGVYPSSVGKIMVAHQQSADSNPDLLESKRWNDYGIGLLEQGQSSAAAHAFRRASALNPREPNLLVNAAIAEMQTERFGLEREQWHKAAALLDAALKLAPAHWRSRYFRAIVWRGTGKLREAADELTQIAQVYPRDREVRRQLGQALYSLGRLAEARQAFEAVRDLDPTDFGAHQFLAPLYASQGLHAEAERERRLYLLWRDDPRADEVIRRFFATHPQWTDEWVGSHVHIGQSPRRPVVTGTFAAPDR